MMKFSRRAQAVAVGDGVGVRVAVAVGDGVAVVAAGLVGLGVNVGVRFTLGGEG
jgi:hypothetical protein